MQTGPSIKGVRRWMAVGAVAALALGACGGDDDDAGDDDAAAGDDGGGDDGGGDDAGGGDDGAGGNGGGGGDGFVEIGSERIEFDSARCFLEEQDAAAGGGKILMVGQGMGTDAAGDEVLFDFTRFDEDSDFAGDDVSVVIGDFRAGTDTSWAAKEPIGTVDLDGQTLSAEGMTFTNFDADPPEETGSFELNC